MVSYFQAESGNQRIKKPSDHVLRAVSTRSTKVANVYNTMKLTVTEGRLIFKQVKDILINSNIDFNVPFSMQKKAELRKLRKQICKNIPYLSRYEDYWPVDIIMERHFHRYSVLSANQIVAEHLTVREPEAGPMKSAPFVRATSEGHGTLHDLLLSTNTFHLALALMRGGLTDGQQFQNFLDMPCDVQKSFLSFSLQGYAKPHEIDAIHAAAKDLREQSG